MQSSRDVELWFWLVLVHRALVVSIWLVLVHRDAELWLFPSGWCLFIEMQSSGCFHLAGACS